jgi:hypothetical protein
VPEQPGPRPARARRQPSSSRRAPRTGRPAPNGGRDPVRDRLRRDPFLFTLCLVGLGFLTSAFALVWWVIGGLLPLALAIASVAPALYLIYLRDA